MKDGRYDYIETGSLLSLKRNTENIILPSEEKHIQMYPLDFEEFLWALGDTTTIPFLKMCFDEKKPLGQALHRKVMNDFRQYILVGGMPQAVNEYIATKDFANVDEIKRDILTLYRNDISKFAKGYENIVAQTLRTNGHKLFFYSRYDKEKKENNMELDFLIKDGVIHLPIYMGIFL